MGQIVPDAIEQYLTVLNRWNDAVLDEIARDGAARDLPLVDREVGVLLAVLARAVGARRILEIGTATGYSGIWLARALPPGGVLITLEIDRDRAAEAKRNFERAGVADQANVLVGDATLTLAKVAGPFDVIFQDGAKALYEPLLDRLILLLRPGGLLITDNVLWSGEVVPGFESARAPRTEDARAIAAYNARLASDSRLMTSVLPLRDGVAVSLKLDGVRS
jgi:predicted O-methyltransferase YrrM